MKIVIAIPETAYNYFAQGLRFTDDVEMAILAIVDGTPLPKGHGRLIDADEFEETFGKMCPSDCGACDPKRKTDGRGRWYDTCLLIDEAPTIIEADNTGSELDNDPIGIKALTRIKENYERVWGEHLLSEDSVREEYEAVCAGIEALENLIPQVCSVPQEEKKDEG